LKGWIARGIVATAVAAAGLLWAVGAAQAHPKIYVLPAVGSAGGGKSPAVGLYVPGAGGSVSRADAIAALRRGKVADAALGTGPHGPILVDVVFGLPPQPATKAVYVTLPPAGRHPNTRRYAVMIVAPGFGGVLSSSSTRIRGLVSLPDITETAIALAAGHSPPVRSHPDRDALQDLRDLDTRLSRVHRDRGWTLVVVILTTLAVVVVAPRAGVLAGASSSIASLILAASGATRFGLVLAAMGALTAGLALAGSVRRKLLPVLVAAFLVGFTVVLAVDPELNSLGVFGARPDGGGRFYGIGNQVETLLLAPVLAAAAIAGLRWLPAFGVLALVTLGWSKAGADGGGVLVFGAALAFLALRLSGVPLTVRRVALASAAVVVVGLALVGLDAALGGSSHVTHAVGGGPGSLFGDLGHRLHISWASATDRWDRVVLFIAFVGALVLFGLRRPRLATVDALLLGIALSLLANDTPVDVVGLGALGCAALIRWETVDSRPMRRATVFAACVCAVLLVAGCGSKGVTLPKPSTVVGTVQAAAPGKAIFIAQGCGSCHTYTPAGPDANGQIGPDLDNLAAYAKTAKQPLAAFIHTSIVNPDKYVGKDCRGAQCPKGVMPKSYKSLPAADLTALVDFLSKPKG
jgi:cytochrome c551/c552